MIVVKESNTCEIRTPNENILLGVLERQDNGEITIHSKRGKKEDTMPFNDLLIMAKYLQNS